MAGGGSRCGWGAGGRQRVASDATEAGGGGLRGDARGDRTAPAHVSARFKSWRRAEPREQRARDTETLPGPRVECWSAQHRL